VRPFFDDRGGYLSAGGTDGPGPLQQVARRPLSVAQVGLRHVRLIGAVAPAGRNALVQGDALAPEEDLDG
jgi:hypothetical protein